MQILNYFTSVSQKKYQEATFYPEVFYKKNESITCIPKINNEKWESGYNYNIRIRNDNFEKPVNSSLHKNNIPNHPFLFQQSEIPLNEHYASEPQNLDNEDQELKVFSRDEWRIEYGDYISNEILNDIPKPNAITVKDFFIRFKKIFLYVGLTTTLALFIIQYLIKTN